MDKSLFLAEFWGWYLIIFFFILVINTKRINQKLVYIKDEKLLIIFSIIAIIVGLLNVLFHNIWTNDWRIIITLFGWLPLIKGIIFFAFPTLSNKWISKFHVKWFQFLLIFTLFMGIFLLNKAYSFLIY